MCDRSHHTPRSPPPGRVLTVSLRVLFRRDSHLWDDLANADRERMSTSAPSSLAIRRSVLMYCLRSQLLCDGSDNDAPTPGATGGPSVTMDCKYTSNPPAVRDF